MAGKFKLVIIFLLFISNIHAEDTKNVSIFFIYNSNLKTEAYLSINNLIDTFQSSAIEKYADTKFKFESVKSEDMNPKQISGEIFAKGGNCYYLYDATGDGIDVKLYSVFNELVFTQKMVKIDNKYANIENYLDSLDMFFSLKSSVGKKFGIKRIEYVHDFPYVNVGVTALSLKIYFDSRTSSKMFSFFPLEIRFAYYPLKYMEVGAFLRFDVGEMVYRYIDLNDGSYKNYDSPFDLSYGVFCGFSLFTTIAHYSIGIQFSNMFYSVTAADMKKPDNLNGLFLPQIGIYQKVDFKLYKFLNYSIFFNLKTMPLFVLDRDRYFYSNPFSVDFVDFEFSLLGLSLTF